MDLDELRNNILTRPWRSIGLAFAAGAALAYANGLKRGLAGSIAFALLRDLAGASARSWIDQRERPFARA